MNVISKILFGQQVGYLDDPDFRNDFIKYNKEAFEMGWTVTALPELIKSCCQCRIGYPKPYSRVQSKFSRKWVDLCAFFRLC
jgi:hypothetical protein